VPLCLAALPRKWATFRGLTGLHSASANRHRAAETFRAGPPIQDRHCAPTANEWLRRWLLVLHEKQLRFQFLGRARKLGADEEDRTPPGVVLRHQTGRPGGQTHSASTHRRCANIAPDSSATARPRAATAETFPRNQSSAPATREVKWRLPPSRGYGNNPRVPFAFITRSTPI